MMRSRSYVYTNIPHTKMFLINCWIVNIMWLAQLVKNYIIRLNLLVVSNQNLLKAQFEN